MGVLFILVLIAVIMWVELCKPSPAVLLSLLGLILSLAMIAICIEEKGGRLGLTLVINCMIGVPSCTVLYHHWKGIWQGRNQNDSVGLTEKNQNKPDIHSDKYAEMAKLKKIASKSYVHIEHVIIETWEYSIEILEDHRIRVWHYITREDGGYGNNVDVTLPADYFETHSALAFYEYIASMNLRPASAYSIRDKELPEVYRVIERIRKAQSAEKDGRRVVLDRIPLSYRYIYNITERGSSEEGQTQETIDLYQDDETGKYYLYYKKRAYSFQFAAGSIVLRHFYLEISEEERNASNLELIRLVDSVRSTLS